MITGPQDPAAGGDRLRAGHADREQVIEALKAAFTQGRLSGEELDARTGQALAARTYAELAAVTADVPAADISAGLAAAAPAHPPAPVRQRRPLVRTAAGSGGCAVVAFTALRIFDVVETEPWTGPGPAPHHSFLLALLVAAVAAVVMALFILGYGVGTSIEMRRSRRQLPLRTGPGGHAQEARPHRDIGHDRVPTGVCNPATWVASSTSPAYTPTSRLVTIAYANVREMILSMSNSRYLKMATPMQTGTPSSPRPAMSPITPRIPGSCVSQAAKGMPAAARADPAASHFSYWRRSPDDRR